MQTQETIAKQPWLPRVKMIWFFLAVFLTAVGLWIVRVADQGYAFATAFMFAAAMVVFFFVASAFVFIFAFIFGSTIRGIEEIDAGTESPFSSDHLPDQIVPPSTPDS